MLKCKDIERIYQSGIELIVTAHKNPAKKGEFLGEEIGIYENNIEDEVDFDKTLLHEFIHARDEEISLRIIYRPEGDVEREAEETYLKKTQVIGYSFFV